MTTYDTWREAEVRRVGGPLQREAEALCDRHDAQPRVALCDDASGCYTSMKRDVADVMIRRGQCSPRRLYSTVDIAFDSEGNRID